MDNILKWIITLGFLYVFYVIAIQDIVIKIKYRGDKLGIDLHSEYNNETLYDELKDNFFYPEMKHIRLNENGECTIQGKYTSHVLIIRDNKLYIDKGKIRNSEKKGIYILEAQVIYNYLNKYFNPNYNIDAYVEYEKLKKKQIIKKAIPICICSIFIIVALFYDDGFLVNQVLNKNSAVNIKNSYLDQLNENRSIGSAFDMYFTDCKWKSYKIGNENYVGFIGIKENKQINIIFKVFENDSFCLDNVKIDDNELPIVMQNYLMNEIFQK